MIRKVIPIILAGGAGTRLWPLSRGEAPKQFLKLDGQHSLLHQTITRCQGPLFDTRPIIVGSTDNQDQLLETVQGMHLAADILLEPMRRNSCAAIVAGALRALERDSHAMALVVAADHHIPDVAAFAAAIRTAAEAADDGKIVTFGVRPRYAATGYGYILPQTGGLPSSAQPIARFVEKPDAQTAARYVAEGYLWNSGNFLFKGSSFITQAKRHAPAVLEAVAMSLRQAERVGDCIHLAEGSFSTSPNISVDYAIMEKTAEACVLAVEYFWTDIGTWDSVAMMMTPDASGNVVVGKGLVQDAANVMIHSEHLLTVVVGCDDLVVVTTRDAVLVARKDKTEDVKVLVERLRAEGFAQADSETSET